MRSQQEPTVGLLCWRCSLLIDLHEQRDASQHQALCVMAHDSEVSSKVGHVVLLPDSQVARAVRVQAATWRIVIAPPATVPSDTFLTFHLGARTFALHQLYTALVCDNGSLGRENLPSRRS